MKKNLYLTALLTLIAALSFAQDKEDTRKPDTIFQKVADYSSEGYKSDVEPVKKVSMFQFAADWVNGKTEDMKSSPEDQSPSLFWKTGSK